MKKYIIGAGLLSIVELGIALYLTQWRNTWWTDVSNKNLHGFIAGLEIFTIVALVLCFISATSSYWMNLAAVEWRKKLTPKALMSKDVPHLDNVNQRIQSDTADYPTLFLNLLFGCGKAISYLVVFSTALVMQFSWYYLIILVIYATIATYFARKIAKPLTTLNYKSQQAEATYRANLSAINFEFCILTMLKLAKKQKHLNYFQTFYGQLGVVIPILIIAPVYFTTAMTLGSLMQVMSTMGTILDNLSYGVTSFDTLTKFMASKKRLKELGVV